MKRLAEIEISGEKYPANFSMRAARCIVEKFGDTDKMTATMKSMSGPERMDTVNWLLALLLEQGAAYKRVFEHEDIQPLTAEQLETLVKPSEYKYIVGQIVEILNPDSKREIELEQSKNAQTTQGN